MSTEGFKGNQWINTETRLFPITADSGQKISNALVENSAGRPSSVENKRIVPKNIQKRSEQNQNITHCYKWERTKFCTTNKEFTDWGREAVRESKIILFIRSIKIMLKY